MLTTRDLPRFVPCAVFAIFFSVSTPAGPGGDKPAIPPAARAQLLESHTFFERNDGQSDKRVLYLGQGLGYEVFLTSNGATFVFNEAVAKNHRTSRGMRRVVRLSLVGADPRVEVSGADALAGKSNYFSGSDPKGWHTQIPQFVPVLVSVTT